MCLLASTPPVAPARASLERPAHSPGVLLLACSPHVNARCQPRRPGAGAKRQSRAWGPAAESSLARQPIGAGL